MRVPYVSLSAAPKLHTFLRHAGNILVRARAPPRRSQAGGAGAAAAEGEAGLPVTLPEALASAAASADPARGATEVAERLQLARHPRCGFACSQQPLTCT